MSMSREFWTGGRKGNLARKAAYRLIDLLHRSITGRLMFLTGWLRDDWVSSPVD
jgi:hypothetical protein